MKKKTFAIYTVLMLVFVIAAGFIGYDLGKAKGSVFAKNTNAKNLTKITSNGASSKKNDKDSKTTDASFIAIVNLDEGVKVKDKTIYYSQKVSEFPTSDFYFTSLSEAEKGVSEGSNGRTAGKAFENGKIDVDMIGRSIINFFDYDMQYLVGTCTSILSNGLYNELSES